MTSAIINRIGRKVQLAVAGLVVASSLAVALPMTASAQTCRDYNQDGAVNIGDLVFVVTHQHQPNPIGAGNLGIVDVVIVIQELSQHTC